MHVLAGDIGGTKTILALYEGLSNHHGERTWHCVRKETYSTKSFNGLEEVALGFLGGASPALAGAAFAVAGPVVQGRCELTNASWTLDASRLHKALNVEQVFLANDLEAAAFGVSTVTESDVRILQKGDVAEDDSASTRVTGIIGAGTGLGKSALLCRDGMMAVVASEGGHADFAPRSPLQWQLLEFLEKTYHHVSVERVLSGDGIVSIHEFLIQKGMARADALKDFPDDDRAALIATLALSHQEPGCDATMRLFFSIYGAETGNWALNVLSKAGMFLIGSIAQKSLNDVYTKVFLDAFLDKDRMGPLLEKIPVSLVCREDIGVLGALAFLEYRFDLLRGS